MKTWKIVTLSAIILLLLVVRIFRQHMDDFLKEREWYISKLNFDFSAEVDTVRKSSHVVFHVTNGNFDGYREYRLNQHLKHNGRITLFLYLPDQQMNLMSDSARLYQTGDSLYFNTSKNKVFVYRNKNLIFENELTKSLRGRPF